MTRYRTCACCSPPKAWCTAASRVRPPVSCTQQASQLVQPDLSSLLAGVSANQEATGHTMAPARPTPARDRSTVVATGMFADEWLLLLPETINGVCASHTQSHQVLLCDSACPACPVSRVEFLRSVASALAGDCADYSRTGITQRSPVITGLRESQDRACVEALQECALCSGRQCQCASPADNSSGCLSGVVDGEAMATCK